MTEATKSKLRWWLWFGVALLAAASMWNYVLRIWSAGQPAGFSDLYSSWWATHELLLHGRNPYTPAVAHEIQATIYGAPVTPSADDPGAIAGGFAYPVYVVFWMSPTIWAGFATVRVLFAGILAGLSVASLRLYGAASDWQAGTRELVTAGLFLLGSFPVAQGIKLENLSLLAGFLIAAALFCMAKDRLVFAGVLFALATFKPQFVVLLIAWIGMWSLADWRARRRLVWSFVPSMVGILIASEMLLPGWMGSFLHIAVAYRHYTYGRSVLDVWFTRSGGAAAAVVLVFSILVLSWKSRASPPQSARFFLNSSFVLAGTLVMIPTLEPHAQVLLVPGLVWLVQYRGRIWRSGRVLRLLAASAWCLLGFEWAAAVSLAVLWWLNRGVAVTLKLLPVYSSPLLPLAVCLALGGVLMKPEGLAPEGPRLEPR
jgi:hypothetical protein